MREGQAVGPVTVVQTSGAADRAGRLAAFDGRPLPIVVRGLENGEPVERTEYTHVPRSWPVAVDRLGRGRAHRRRGGASRSSPTPATAATACPEGETIGDCVPVSFPAKLTKLLAARWEKSGVPLTVFATELVPDNGVVLRRLCTEIAERSGLPPAFLAWLNEDCVFANSLVDRITTDGARAGRRRHRALCAVGDRAAGPADVPLHAIAAIRVVDDLKVTERLKLFLLNLAAHLPRRALARRRPSQGRDGARDASPTRKSAPGSTRSTTRRSCRSSRRPGSPRRRPTGRA